MADLDHSVSQTSILTGLTPFLLRLMTQKYLTMKRAGLAVG